MNSAEKPAWWWSWRTNAVALALLAAVFSALTFVNDTNVLHNVIVSADPFTSVLAYLVLGSWIGVAVNFVYNRMFGSFIEPSFSRESFGHVRTQLYVFGAGALASVYTFSYLLVANDGDPSILIALSNFAIVYLALNDHYRAGLSASKTLPATVLVLLGAALTAVERADTGIQITLRALVLMLLISSTSDAASRVLEKKVVVECGGVNLAFWRFLWLAVCSTVLAVVVAVVRGSLDGLWVLLMNTWLSALPWVVLTMLLAYGGNTLRIVAQRYGSLSTVAIVRSSQIAMAVPLTLFIASVSPDWAFTLPSQPVVWILRLVGTGLIIWGVLSCPKPREGGN